MGITSKRIITISVLWPTVTHWPPATIYICTYTISKTNEISFNFVVTAYVPCNIVFSSLVHHVRPDDGLIGKGPKHVVYLLTPLHLNKVLLCFDVPTLYQL